MNTEQQIPYTYCFIRKDLPIAQQIIQTAHAIQEITKKVHHPREVSHIVLLEASNDIHLFNIQIKLQDMGIKYEMFYEPDIQQCTAIATEPIYGNDRKKFRKFRFYN